MDIVNRLKFFLDQQGLTSSQFADACRIPRPTLSQLLTGRNKKVSDEIFAKIHDAFPQLSILWLMFGEGQPITGPTPVTQGDPSSPAGGVGDFSGMGPNAVMDLPASSGNKTPGMIDFGNSLFDTDPTDFGVEQTPAMGNSQNGSGSLPLSQLGATASNQATATGDSPAEASAGKGTISINPDANKKITSIVVFYNDNSFQSFAPTA